MFKRIQIRKAELRDVDLLFEIELGVFGEDEETVSHKFESIISSRDPNSLFYVLLFEGEVKGFYCVLIEENEALLADLVVSKELHHQGLGSLLLDHALKLVQEKNCRLIKLTVRECNTPARRLYEKKGFKTLEFLPNYYGDESGVRYQKGF